jgi:cell division protein FtsA
MAAKPVYAVGLDAGAASTRCVIGVVEDSCLRLLGFGVAPSQGWIKGRIGDQRAVAASLLAAVQEAERVAQTPVESVVVGIGGPTVRGANNRAAIEVGRPRELEQRDVNRAVEKAGLVLLQEDRMVLQLFPQDFVVDDHPGHRDPRRMIASRLEANVHLLTASAQEHHALIGAVNLAHLAVEESVFEPIAACYAAALPEERREGLALVDFGAHSTQLVAYHGEALLLAWSLPVGGDFFTRDVARGLHATFEDAQLLKAEYGCAILGLTGDNIYIEVPSPGDREPREAPRRMLNQILEARAEELFRLIRRELARVGMDQALMGGVLLTGGEARLNGMCDMAERVLNCQARKGLAIGIEHWPEELADPAWTTSAGLAMYSARLKLRHELERRATGLLGRIFR